MEPWAEEGWTFDPVADAIYLTIRPEALMVVTVPLHDSDVHLDIDPVTGVLVGIEILGAGTAFPKLRRLLAAEPKILEEGENEKAD